MIQKPGFRPNVALGLKKISKVLDIALFFTDKNRELTDFCSSLKLCKRGFSICL